MTTGKKLTVQIVGWNSADVLTTGLSALEKIPIEDIDIVYLDNASTDGSADLVQQILPAAKIIQFTQNIGFARAHNIGLTQCQTPFVLVHDPDVTINWQGIVSLLNRFNDPRVGAVQGKLLRSVKEGTRSIIDSAGIKLSSALNGVERGADEIDLNQYQAEETVIATTAACSLYRLAALKAVAYGPEEFFDNDFFSYKEDVDLGWRLNNAGWQVLFIPIYAGQHQRTLGKRGAFNWGLNPVSVYQRLRSPRTRYSIRNWLWMIVKNAGLLQILAHGLPIAVRITVLGSLSLTYPPLVKVWFEAITGLPTVMSKRWHKAAGPT